MKAIGDTNEAYNQKDRNFIQAFFGLKKYDKRDISQKRLKNIWDRKEVSNFSPFLPYSSDSLL